MKLVFDWAKASGYRDGQDNPTEGLTKVLPKHKGDKQHLAALPYQAVPAFVTALQTIPEMQDAVRCGLEFLILTATRTNEVQLADLDGNQFDDKTWTIPGVRMKSGREHRVPLSDRVDRAAHAGTGARWSVRLSRHEARQAALEYDLLESGPPIDGRRTHDARLSKLVPGLVRRTDERVPRGRPKPRSRTSLRDKTEAAYSRTDLFDKRRDVDGSLGAVRHQHAGKSPGA